MASTRGAQAQCADWLAGPFDDGTAPEGADGTIFASIMWGSTLVVAGHFTTIEGVAVNHIAARDPETGEWQDLAGGMDELFFPDVRALMVYEGDLIAGGNFDTAGGVEAASIARWDGSQWHPLGAGIDNAYVNALFVYNGDLIAGGSFSTAGGIPAHGVARWDGSAWHALGSGVGGGTPHALGFYAGSLIVGGDFDVAGGLTVNSIAAWNGSTWSSLGNGMAGYVYGISLWNGFLIAGGTFNSAGGVNAKNIARWNGSSWAPLGTGLAPPDGQAGGVECLLNFGGDLIAGGDFVTAGGITANHIARWNGTWTNLSTGTNSHVLCLERLGTETIAGGFFSTAGGVPAHSLARWDGSNWGSFGGGTAGIVLAFTTFGSRIVAGGDFHQSTAGQVAHNIVSWDGNELRPFADGADFFVEALKGFKYPGPLGDNELIAGGQFTHAGGIAANRIARWVESAFGGPAEWEAMGAGFNSGVAAIERFDNTTYAGGTFTGSGATPVNRIARWNEGTGAWEALGTGMNGTVNAIKGYNGFLYAGGSFTNAGGVSTGGLARWNGTSWSQVGGFFLGTVLALEVHNGRLVMAGTFPGLAGSPNIAQYNGSFYTTLGTGGTNGSVVSLRSTGSRLYIGGEFNTAGGVSVNGIAYFDGTWHPVEGGVQVPPVMALTSANDEVHAGGVFQTVGLSGLTSPSWARFTETGAPWIVRHPATRTQPAGTDVTFSVIAAEGYIGLDYEWRKDGIALANGPTGSGSVISGADTPTLTIEFITPADEGAYVAVVANACGSATSLAATLTVEGTVGIPPQGAPLVTTFESLGPNPSRGTATAAFSLAHSAAASVHVYDVAGRLVREIRSGVLPGGRHQTTWDARGQDGRPVAAGLYFVALEIDGRRLAAKRLVILH
jgi:hypothetical protein